MHYKDRSSFYGKRISANAIAVTANEGFWRMHLQKPSISLHMASSVEGHRSQLSWALKFTECASRYQRLLENRRCFITCSL